MPLKKEKALLIINPKAGKQGAKRYFFAIVNGLSMKYTLTTYITQGADDARIAASQAGDFSTVICCGGDGTLSQVIDGYPLSERPLTVGYIPCGTTNDFASTMKLQRNIPKAIKDVCLGKTTCIDIGSFNGKKFMYIASFGAFTKASYSTPQDVKNIFGSLSYIMNGAMELTSIKKEEVTIVCDEVQTSYKDICFAAVMNTHSVAGMIKISPEAADLSDGKHELILIRMPRDLQHLGMLISNLLQSKLGDPDIIFMQGSHIEIHTKNKVAWTLDGEAAGEFSDAIVENIPHALNLICPSPGKKDSNENNGKKQQ